MIGGWTLANEYRFIDSLGSCVVWENFHGGNTPSRQELLAGYLVGLGKRTLGMRPEDVRNARARAMALLNDPRKSTSRHI